MENENEKQREPERINIAITSVDLDGSSSTGYYIDDEGDLRSVLLTYGEALAMQKEFRNGVEAVGYEIVRWPNEEAVESAMRQFARGETS